MITGKMLKDKGWDGKALGLALAASRDLQMGDADALDYLAGVAHRPEQFLKAGESVAALAKFLIPPALPEGGVFVPQTGLTYPIFGADHVEPDAIAQMDGAMSLPISVAGALMADAHPGYGLPIGGVWATSDSVVPFAVGVDIACRMRLSIYEMSPHTLKGEQGRFRKALMDNTYFGMGAARTVTTDDEVLDDADWKALPLLRNLHSAAVSQLGTSGGGNHFVEWGELELFWDSAQLKAGKYLALLSHSGSRSIGFKIANYYSKLAESLHPNLPENLKHLAWLDLKTEAGQEYWLAMELAGRFASASHRVIHHSVAKAAGLKEVAVVENHHNFAWKEMYNGQEVIVHRKGATPAGFGVVGMIPGSMGDPGYVVMGKGEAQSLNSASHGAGRRMGRKQAERTFTKTQMDAYLKERDIKLLGGGLDEAPMVYKDIEGVMAAQEALVEKLGRFMPKMVRMAEDASEF